MDTKPLIELVGVPSAVERIIYKFYTYVELDKPLRSIYPKDLQPGKEKLRLFLEQWLDGAPQYSNLYGHPRLRRRHFPFIISEENATRWLMHMRNAFESEGLSDEIIATIFERLTPLAYHMVNEGEDIPREPLQDTRLT